MSSRIPTALCGASASAPSRAKSEFCKTTKTFRTHGFTLLEVLVALAILGIVITTALELLSGSMNLAAVSREYAEAVQLAGQQMDRILDRDEMFKQEDWPQGGTFENGYNWTIQIEALEIQGEDEGPALPLKTYICYLEVRWQSGRHERTVVLDAVKTVEQPQFITSPSRRGRG